MEAEETAECLTGPDAERRHMPRCAVDEEASLLLVGHGGGLKCRIVELSLTGCRISTRERLPSGIGHRVEAVFKVRGVAFRFIGVAEWTDGQNLVGMRFVDMPARRRDELVEVLCEIKTEGAAELEKGVAEEGDAGERAAGPKPAAEMRTAAERADQENFAAELRVATELAAEKKALEHAEWQAEMKAVAEERDEADAAAVQSGPEPQQAALEPVGRLDAPSTRPVKRERRQQSRHAVDTSAAILLINVGSLLQGRIVDLSLSGCRVRTEERFPVGIYTRVETEFWLGGLPFRLGGVIQAVHDRDRRNVGIRFLDISARKREQVEQLIEEIEEMRAEKSPAGPEESGFESQGSKSSSV
jgi:c-di-GMP-binding flagellar brake protein YcgR